MRAFIRERIEGIGLAEPQAYRHISVVPLLPGDAGDLDYITMGEALEAGALRVSEVHESGSVPDLKVTSTSDRPILLLDGEELAGAKQNRVLNTTILLQERADVVVPVSCTEAGRWGYTTDTFAASGHLMSRTARARKTRSVSASLEDTSEYRSDQGEVWASVDELHSISGTHSVTRAMCAAYDQRREDLAAARDAFSCLPGQGGLLVQVNGEVVGFDCVPRAAAYARLHDKLLGSYLVEALFRQPGDAATGEALERAKAFLAAAVHCGERPFASVGYGTDYRYLGDGLVGSCLAHREQVVHAAFFRLDAEGLADWMPGLGARRRFRA